MTGTYDSRFTLVNRHGSKQKIYGPLALVVNRIGHFDIKPSNSSGTTPQGLPYFTIPLPQEGLAPGKKITNIIQFDNPGHKKFSPRYAIYQFLNPATGDSPTNMCAAPADGGSGGGQTGGGNSGGQAGGGNGGGTDACSATPGTDASPPQISQVIPASAPTGSVVTIIGINFNACSKIFVGDIEVKGPTLVSDHEVQVIVPFDTDAQGNLIPLASGNYSIKVSDSSSHDFSVTDLPTNPNLPGTFMANIISHLSQSFNTNHTVVQAALDQLRAINTDPAMQGLLDMVSRLLQSTGDLIFKDLPLLPSHLSPQTLDTLERVLMTNNLDANFLIAYANPKNQLQTAIGLQIPGYSESSPLNSLALLLVIKSLSATAYH